MALHSVSIETLKKTLDTETLRKVFEEEAEKKASSFKYIVNIFKDSKSKKGYKYCQLRGTVGYSKSGKKLWVAKTIGKITDESLDKHKLCLTHKQFMKDKAKDSILNEFLNG
jgi:hypothetical protein